jgi:hypothetical protein
MKISHLFIYLTFVFIACSVSAQEADDGRNKEVDKAYAKLLTYLPENAQLIHIPYADKLNSYGANHTVVRKDDADVTGGKLLQLRVNRASKNVWDDAVTADIGGEIKKGDVIYMMLWARISPEDKDNDSVTLPAISIQKSSAPYSKVVSKDITLSPGWQTLAIAGKASDDFPNYGSQLNFPIASGKHIIEFGPVFVFNLGPDADMRTLPFID